MYRSSRSPRSGLSSATSWDLHLYFGLYSAVSLFFASPPSVLVHNVIVCIRIYYVVSDLDCLILGSSGIWRMLFSDGTAIQSPMLNVVMIWVNIMDMSIGT